MKFGANPSTISLVNVVTDRQTDTHTHTHTGTNAGENIFPRFRGDNKSPLPRDSVLHVNVNVNTNFYSALVASESEALR